MHQGRCAKESHRKNCPLPRFRQGPRLTASPRSGESRVQLREARVHLHAVVLGAALWKQHLQFRNHLREDAELRESYSALKRELALAHAADKAAYTAAKAPFIQQVLLGR